MTGPVVAIMQPYFFPYAGYFRLLAAADIFVIFDCVQFPRRGWVHRNRLHDAGGQLDWLTLPLAKAAYHATIADLRFREDAAATMAQDVQRFPAVTRFPDKEWLTACAGSPADYLEQGLRLTCERLGLKLPRLLRSSSLQAPADLRAAERIIWLAQKLGAATYINAPGGRAIYNAEAFTAAGIQLKFLSEYQGTVTSMLERLALEPAATLSQEIIGQCALED